MRKFQKIRFDELADIIFAVLFLELLIKRDYVRALHHFLADLECILIRLVDLIELLHEIQLAVLGSLVVCAIVSGVDHLFLLVSPDHSKILYNNMSYQSFLLGFEELALDAVEVELQLVALIEGFLILGDDKYGDFSLNKALQKKGLKRMFLHAFSMKMKHLTPRGLI